MFYQGFFFFSSSGHWWSFLVPWYCCLWLAQLGIFKLINQSVDSWSCLPNVDVFPLRNEHCYYVFIDTVKLLWYNCNFRVRASESTTFNLWTFEQLSTTFFSQCETTQTFTRVALWRAQQFTWAKSNKFTPQLLLLGNTHTLLVL